MIPLVRFWIWYSTFAALAGWTLSALGQLNRPGYVIAFGLFAAFLVLRRRDLEIAPAGASFRLSKLRRRFRRRWPLGFVVLALLVFLGSAIYPPTHYNAVTYHIPRVLNWLAAGQWHWIATPVERMNYTGCDFEWLSAPLLLFTHSARPLFLLNFLPFLLLPGLVFSVFTRLGVRARVAWHWMWLFPTGYIFLLQAGSAGNDALAAVYALAAVDFGCRAWVTRRPRDLLHSLLAVALLTGTKPVGLPLLLPWAILVFPLLPRLWRAKSATLFVSGLALVISFFPIALMNQLHHGGWLGTKLEIYQMDMRNPATGLAGNAVQLSLQNFVPPLFPLAGWWNRHVPQWLPDAWAAQFQAGSMWVGELPTEDWSGLGFGLSLLLAVSAVAARCRKNSSAPPAEKTGAIPAAFLKLVILAPWLALAFFCAKSAMNTPARLIAPYYPLLLPLLLLGAGQTQIVRRAWWQWLAALAVLLALAALVLSPDRPLWPARPVLSRLVAQHPEAPLFSRALNVYTVYAQRADPLAAVRQLLPPGLGVVGFIGAEDDSDLSLWMPFGSRRVAHFRHTDPPGRFRQSGVAYVVVGELNLKLRGTTFDEWRQRTGAELVSRATATEKVSEGPQNWFLVRFHPAPRAAHE